LDQIFHQDILFNQLKNVVIFFQDLCPRLTAELGEDVKNILSLLLKPLAINYGATLYDAMKVFERFSAKRMHPLDLSNFL
jgi:hypothetical protein